MSTIFGVLIPASKHEEEQYCEIAFRSSNGIVFTNPVAVLLADTVPVEPLDNTPQGIYTIGDIKKQIQEQENKNK